MKNSLRKVKNAVNTWKKTATKLGISRDEQSRMEAAFRI